MACPDYSSNDGKTPQKGFVSSGLDKMQWFVMRDLKRHNAKHPAYKMLGDMQLEVFTPMVWKLLVRGGKREPEEVPFMQDLLFVHTTRRTLDPIVEMTATLQYRYLRGLHYVPMTVREADMDRFIKAVKASKSPRFYTPSEITPAMVGKKVRIIGGPLDCYEGRLQKMQGSTVKRLFVELPDLLVASVEVQPDFVQLVK